jgi:hypothetical protein
MRPSRRWFGVDGRITNASLTDYVIATTLDMPPVEAVFVEEPEPDAPYDAKERGSRRPSSRPSRSLPRFATRRGKSSTGSPSADDIVGL